MIRGMLRKAVRLARRASSRRACSSVSRRVKSDGLTFLTYRKLNQLEDAISAVQANGVPGDFVEAGVARGGSGIVMATLMEEGRRFRGYDLFGMIPPPSSMDPDEAHQRYETIREGAASGIGDHEEYYGYTNDLYGRVIESFREYGVPMDGENVQLVEGSFEETLRFDDSERIALLHVDCDWYEPTKLVLQRSLPHLSEGGVVVIDDYWDYEGSRKATGEIVEAMDSLTLTGEKPAAVVRKEISSPRPLGSDGS